jgi:hypothetical protein
MEKGEGRREKGERRREKGVRRREKGEMVGEIAALIKYKMMFWVLTIW